METFTIEDKQEVLCDLSNSTTCNDREWHWPLTGHFNYRTPLWG